MICLADCTMYDICFNCQSSSLFACCCRVNGTSGTIGTHVRAICAVSTVLTILSRQSRYMAHQVTDACATKQFKERRNLCYHVHNVAGDATGSHTIVAIVAVAAGGDDSNLIYFAQWLGDGTYDFRHACEQLIKNSGLVIFMKSPPFHFHPVAFALTFTPNNFPF